MIIKYRAWDKKDRFGMAPVQIIDFESKYIIVANGFEWNEDTETGEAECEAKFDEIELMEFTGLFDKHNTPIFEGDVVEIKNVFTDRSIVKFGIQDVDDNERYSYNTVCGFYLNLIYRYGNYADGRPYKQVSNNFNHMDKLDQYEVIGNIWENPDLLNNGEGK